MKMSSIFLVRLLPPIHHLLCNIFRLHLETRHSSTIYGFMNQVPKIVVLLRVVFQFALYANEIC